jgi:hypothetical protein
MYVIGMVYYWRLRKVLQAPLIYGAIAARGISRDIMLFVGNYNLTRVLSKTVNFNALQFEALLRRSFSG